MASTPGSNLSHIGGFVEGESALTTVPPLLINIAAETKSTTSQASGRKRILVFNFPTKITSVQIIQQ